MSWSDMSLRYPPLLFYTCGMDALKCNYCCRITRNTFQTWHSLRQNSSARSNASGILRSTVLELNASSLLNSMTIISMYIVNNRCAEYNTSFHMQYRKELREKGSDSREIIGKVVRQISWRLFQRVEKLNEAWKPSRHTPIDQIEKAKMLEMLVERLKGEQEVEEVRISCLLPSLTNQRFLRQLLYYLAVYHLDVFRLTNFLHCGSTAERMLFLQLFFIIRPVMVHICYCGNHNHDLTRII